MEAFLKAYDFKKLEYCDMVKFIDRDGNKYVWFPAWSQSAKSHSVDMRFFNEDYKNWCHHVKILIQEHKTSFGKNRTKIKVLQNYKSVAGLDGKPDPATGSVEYVHA